jgi:mannose-6-phosphate isomerase-like protein (cupin superfamily)
MIETPQQYTARLLSLSANTDPLTVLQTTAARLRTMIAGRTHEELGRQPELDRWSVVQILAHLADAEIVGAWRFRSVLESDGVALQAFDQNVWADGFRYADTDPFESVQLFDVNRRATLALLARVEPKRREHHGMHAERGRESVDHLVRLYAGHDLNHLGQVERLIGSLPPLAFKTTPAASRVANVLGPRDGRSGFLGSIGARFVIDGAESGGGFSLVEHPMSPRALGAPLHRHTREDEYSYVLAGRVGALLGDEVVTGNPGDLIVKPRYQWHTFWNAGDEPARILEIISPAGFERYFAELVELGGSRKASPQALRSLGEKYGLEVNPQSIPELLERFTLVLGAPVY